MSDKFTLVRAPKGQEKCKLAFFPGCCICAQEPEIIVKLYDALLFQDPSTAMFMQCCDDVDEIREEWAGLGKPEMILCCSECEEVFAEKLPEIPVVSLYDKLHEYKIGGGCNSVDYCLHESVKDKSVTALAEDMGVTLHEHEDDSPFPYLVNDINTRNKLKESGKDAAHILELMFGMGASNTHLIHEHDHGEEAGADAKADETECDGNCAACAGCHDKPHPPQPLPSEEKKEANRLELKEVLLALFWDEM